MPNFEHGGFSPESEQLKKTLIQGTMGNEELGASLKAFAEQSGKTEADISTTSPEGMMLRREWLLQQTEMSPELNNEVMYALRRIAEELETKLRAGDKDGALAAIKQQKGLLEKLEQGVSNID